jgi:hypothetical protein
MARANPTAATAGAALASLLQGRAALIHNGSGSRGANGHADAERTEIESSQASSPELGKATRHPPLPPPSNQLQGYSYLTLNIQKLTLNLMEATKNANTDVLLAFEESVAPPYLSACLCNRSGQLVEPRQDHSLMSTRAADALVCGSSLHIQTPIEQLEPGSRIMLTLYRYSPSSGSITVATAFITISHGAINSGYLTVQFSAAKSALWSAGSWAQPDSSGATLMSLGVEMVLTMTPKPRLVQTPSRMHILEPPRPKGVTLGNGDVTPTKTANRTLTPGEPRERVVMCEDYPVDFDGPRVAFKMTLPADCKPGQIIRDVGGHKDLAVKVHRKSRPGDIIVVMAPASKF